MKGTHHRLAVHLYNLGFSLLPLAANKVPVVKWNRLQAERCSRADVDLWFRDNDWRPGIITGGLSGIVVVDCDDAGAVGMIENAGCGSDVRQATKRGRHFVFRHPGVLTRNRRRLGGQNIDVRGDGGYVVAYDDAAKWTKVVLGRLPKYEEPHLL